MTPRVIIADDEYDLAEIFSSLLELKGISVVGVATNGKEAMEMCKKLRPDIVFSDVKMPYYDGYYVAREIKKLKHRPKIVLITGSPTAEVTVELNNLIVDAIICKPVDIHKVIALIKDLT